MSTDPSEPEDASRPEFWHSRWREGRTGFHQSEFNPRLVRLWEGLGVRSGAPVFVPLCGKSRDMLWLAERGHPVLGVELSEIAVRDFFAEAGLEPEWSDDGPFRTAQAAGIRLMCGDFFALTAEHLAGVGGVYDRAAFFALPPPQRRAYAELLCRCLPRDAVVLLLLLEHDNAREPGPPFSVGLDEVRRHFESRFEVEALERGEPEPAPEHLRERGFVSLRQSAAALRARAGG